MTECKIKKCFAYQINPMFYYWFIYSNKKGVLFNTFIFTYWIRSLLFNNCHKAYFFDTLYDSKVISFSVVKLRANKNRCWLNIFLMFLIYYISFLRQRENLHFSNWQINFIFIFILKVNKSIKVTNTMSEFINESFSVMKIIINTLFQFKTFKRPSFTLYSNVH